MSKEKAIEYITEAKEQLSSSQSQGIVHLRTQRSAGKKC